MDYLTLPSDLLGRVVGVPNKLDVGVAQPRRERHELDDVRDAGPQTLYQDSSFSSSPVEALMRSSWKTSFLLRSSVFFPLLHSDFDNVARSEFDVFFFASRESTGSCDAKRQKKVDDKHWFLEGWDTADATS